MSFEAQAWARSQPTANCARKAVLMALANVADADGWVKRVSVVYLVESTDLSRASIFLRLRELEAGGALAREKRGHAGSGAALVSCTLNLPGGYALPEKQKGDSVEPSESEDIDAAESGADDGGAVQRAGLTQSSGLD